MRTSWKRRAPKSRPAASRIFSACCGVLVRIAVRISLTAPRPAVIVELNETSGSDYKGKARAVPRPNPKKGPPMCRRCLAFVWLGLLAGCGRSGIAAPTNGAAVPPSKIVLQRNVELTTVQQRPLVYRVETIFVLEADNQNDIAA